MIGEILSSKVKKNKKGNSVYTALFGQGTFNEQQTLCAEMKDILATVSHGDGRLANQPPGSKWDGASPGLDTPRRDKWGTKGNSSQRNYLRVFFCFDF